MTGVWVQLTSAVPPQHLRCTTGRSSGVPSPLQSCAVFSACFNGSEPHAGGRSVQQTLTEKQVIRSELEILLCPGVAAVFFSLPRIPSKV